MVLRVLKFGAGWRRIPFDSAFVIERHFDTEMAFAALDVC
jgi:hypothetical protein